MANSSPDSCFKEGKFSAPGFRFHPTDEELVVYYLKRKICNRRLRVNVIGVVDVYKVDPAELPGLSTLKSGDRQWFFFTPRNRKYPNAARSGRGTATGYWKATGKDRVIEYNSRSVGLKKTLVFYRGRAPNGERTDWVMHEYTMDEEELGRCKNVKDYYALYKLYKKSGAGPKNGEEYGAPFQEEEWVDDDDDEENHDNNVVLPVHDDSQKIFCNPVNLQLDDLEQLLNGIPDAPGVTQRQVYEGHSNSTLLNNSLLPNMHSGGYQSQLWSANSFDATSEVKSAPSCMAPPLVFEKEDYIEMDDLLLPELGPSSTNNINEFDDLFHDVSMSLSVDPAYQGDLGDFANNNTQGQIYDFLYEQFQDQTPENKLMDPNTNLHQFTDNMLFKDTQAYLFDQPQSSYGAPSSGVIPESVSPAMTVNAQDQASQNGGGTTTTSQFSSALWAFMESIPSTPASACEGPLNRTFVRMSSLSRIRFSGNSQVTTIAKKTSINRGFLILSIIGALCAILWVFIASAGVLSS